MKVQPAKLRRKSTPAISQRSRTLDQSSPGARVPSQEPIFDDLHARITVRAYELYVARGRRDGCADQDWLDAQREILNHTFPE